MPSLFTLPRTSRTAFLLFGAAVASLFSSDSAHAASFFWANKTGFWDSGGNWVGGAAPSGGDATDILVFAGVATPYNSSNNLPAVPSLVNQLVFDSQYATNTGMLDFEIQGAAIALGGTAPQIVQRNSGPFNLRAPLEIRAPLTLTGNGGTVVLGGPLSGVSDIVKDGDSTFRFGFTPDVPSTWSGGLTINRGTIGFDLFSPGGSFAALRGNPVTLTSSAAVLTTTDSLRTGVLSGNSGLVETYVPEYQGRDNNDIVIHALSDGSYGGTLRLGPASGTGKNRGTLSIRGVGKQTLTGTFVAPDSPAGANALQIQKDVAIGHGATLSLAGNTSLAQQGSAGAIVMNGGTFELDNRDVNIPNRLRDGDAGSTGLDTAGGGLFSLIGNDAGTSELMARLQLGSANNPRSGAVTIRVVHTAGTAASTQLSLQSLSRDGSVPTYATVDFSAIDGDGREISLGESGAGPRISFVTPPLMANGLLRNTRSFNAATVGWATVNGSAFATHGPNGIASVPLAATPAADTVGDPTANIELRGGFTLTNPAGYSVNSLRIEPESEGQQLVIQTSGSLNTNAILLAGSHDYTIASSEMNGGGIGGVSTLGAGARYIHVESATLTITARTSVTSLPLVKAGAGTLVLTNPRNSTTYQSTIINAGILRATPNESLPFGELQLRGGVLEITGVTTFSRRVGQFLETVNWTGYDESGEKISEDAGSGGFAAFGNDVTIDLNASGPDVLEWESKGFVDSGHALIFGSRSADHRITWSDHLSLGSTVNYNAREIRINDNSASAGDYAELKGTISGSNANDLLKTGPGTLELTGANSYAGATLVREGTLLVDGAGTTVSSLLADVYSGATLGGDGRIGNVRVRAGGHLSPGSITKSEATLSTGNLTLDGPGANIDIQLGGVGIVIFDRLVVTGTVTLSGGDLLGTLINGFKPRIGDLFFIIINDGSDAVSGTFAQGNEVLFGDTLFQISYSGDSQTSRFTGGNDVVLRAIPEPSAASLLIVGTALLFRRMRRSV